MKNVRKTTVVFSMVVMVVLLFTYCRLDDTVIGATDTSGSTLTSQKTTTAPTIDGTVDAVWANAPIVTVNPVVPNPGNFLFAGYIGDSYDVNLRSLYDDQNVYFLVEWNDPTESLVDRPWYFNPTTKRWLREANNPTFDANGLMTRLAFNEDKLGFLWNIDHSTAGFDTKTCYASCHVSSASIDITTGAPKPATGGNHYTNNANEKIDQWHIHLMKDVSFGQGSDEYQDYNLGLINANGRHADQTDSLNHVAVGGQITNSQSLKITGKTTTVTVPIWIIPNETNYGYYLPTSETLTGGRARKVTAVDSLGVLTYDGGTIDPNVGTDYLQTTDGDGPKCFPSTIASAMTGSRSDLNVKATHNGRGWTLEIKRALKTADVLKQDVDFSSLEDQPFGMAVFNRANNQHAIKPNLLLKFQK